MNAANTRTASMAAGPLGAQIVDSTSRYVCVSLAGVSQLRCENVVELVRLHSQLAARGRRLVLVEVQEAAQERLVQLGMVSVIAIDPPPPTRFVRWLRSLGGRRVQPARV
jgi:hypothetical protein